MKALDWDEGGDPLDSLQVAFLPPDLLPLQGHLAYRCLLRVSREAMGQGLDRVDDHFRSMIQMGVLDVRIGSV